MEFKKIILLIIVLQLCFYGRAQESFHVCRTEAYSEYLIKTNPEFSITNKYFEKKYQSDFSNSYKSLVDSICLPIVVHLIHNNGIENIPDTQIINGIDNLNEAFANRNYYNPNTGVDTKIQFCLAQRDTLGNEFNGILRHSSIYTDMSISGSFNAIVDIAFYNPSEYINLHLVKNACIGGDCNAAGFGGAFRIVVESKYFGVSERIDVLVTHEMGHFLGLSHTFKGGCKNNDCLTDGDRVCDTPPDNQNFEHCISEHNSCSTDEDDSSLNNPFRPINLGGLGDQNDPHHNYMDYNWGECYDQFTQGQADRMHWIIENRYSSLLDSKVCLPPCENGSLAFFTTLVDSIEAGTILNFNNLSTNGTSFEWTIDGDFFSDIENPSLSFDEVGNFNIELEVWNGIEACETNSFSLEIIVLCPVEACIDYEIIEPYLYFSNCSSIQVENNWLILNGNNDTLYLSSSLSLDSFNLSNLSFVQLCLSSNNNICEDYSCEFIDIVTNGSEICNNQKDDDQDGLVDLFDPDCPCINDVYQAQCEVDCQYIPDPSFDFEMKIHWKSDSLVFLGAPLIVYEELGETQISIVDAVQGGSTNAIYKLRTFNGSTGENVNSVLLDELTFFIAACKFNPNEKTKIFGSNRFGFQRYSDDLQLELNSEIQDLYSAGQINLTDLNGDGKTELLKGPIIFNSDNGNILFDLEEFQGCSSSCSFSNSVAGDFLPSEGLELAAGNVLLNVDLINDIDSVGNTVEITIADDPVKDGLTSVGDIDGDGELDIIVVRSGDYSDGGGIYVWNPRTSELIAQGDAGNRGGVAFVGDVDGDCFPEIGVVFENELRLYRFNGTQNLESVYILPTTDDSGFTGMTMFDFNQDGKNEIVYRDETDLKIIEGATGNTLASFPMKSGTGWEYPVIVDIDHDGHVEILISGFDSNFDETYLYCIKSAGTPWAPGRSIWNQYGYNPTYVNDDMTIPRYPQNAAKALEGTENCLQQACSTPYNNFMVQATHRTQAGCFVWPAIDLSLDLLYYTCIGDSLEMDVVISNAADFLRVEDTICINWFYDQIDGNNFLQSNCLPIELSPETSSDTLHFTIGLNGSNPSQVLADISNLLGDDFQECNYLNNSDSIEIDLSSPSLDLGLDIIKCSSEVISFNVGSGFQSYLWNDLSTDSIYSTSLEGLHFVELTDKCGNILRDTVEFIINPMDDIDLGLDMEICDQDSFELVIPEIYDFVKWYPSDKVSCDTCFITEVSSDDNFELVVQVQKDDCISLDSINVNILTPQLVEISAQICEGETYQYLDSIWNQEGLYAYHHAACDTIINLSLDVNPLDTFNLDRQICSGDSIFFNNTWIKNEGIYEELLSNQYDCDSLVELNIIVENQLSSNDSISICPGDSVFYENQWVSDLGLNEISSISTGGCDSLIYLELSYLQEYSLPDELWLCQGDSIMYQSEWVFSNEEYIFNLSSAQGCDSTINLIVNEYDSFTDVDSISLCPGDSTLYNNIWVFPDNDYVISGETVNGCDSVINLRVNENSIFSTVDSLWLCSGDSIMVNGNWIYEDYEYQETQSTNQDCDSINQHFILFEDLPGPPEFSINCETSLIDVSIDPEGWEVLWDNGDVNPMTQYPSEQQINVTLSSANNCEITFDLDLPVLPNFEGIPQFVDTIVNIGDTVIYNFDLNLEEWNVLWSPSDVVSCDTCSIIVVSPLQSTQINIELEHNSGCTYEFSFFIEVAESLEDTYYIPNVFSPNGDNQNDLWQVFFSEESGWLLSEGFIYDRWGNQVKSWKNTSDISWDGKFNNTHLDLGVYMYYLIFEDGNGEEKKVVGNLTLLR